MRQLQPFLVKTFSRFEQFRGLQINLLALLIGVFAAEGITLLRYLIDLSQLFVFGILGDKNLTLFEELPHWHYLIFPPLAGLFVGWFIHRYLPKRKPHGIPQVMVAFSRPYPYIPFRTGILSAIAAAFSIGAGASVGREGPAVHFGASLSSTIARKLNLDGPMARILLGCGVASAVAASFNAPMAATIFAHEVIIGHYGLKSFAPIVVSAVTGTAVSRFHFGNDPTFLLPAYSVSSIWEIPAFVLLGIAAAFAAIFIIRGIKYCQRLRPLLPGPTWITPAYAGFIMGCIGLFYPQVLGIGYDATNEIIMTNIQLSDLLMIALLKICATILCLGLGFAGGIFSPSLVIGAALGGAFGFIATGLFPGFATDVPAYAIAGMSAVAGAVLGAPISTILMIFELTGEYEITIAVMIATVCANLVTLRYIQGKSFFESQLIDQGFRFDQGREMMLLHHHHVTELMHLSPITVQADAPLEEIRHKLQDSEDYTIFVVSDDQKYMGTIRLCSLGHYVEDPALHDLIVAADIAEQCPIMLTAADALDDVIAKTETSPYTIFPVIDSKRSNRLIGMVQETELLKAYKHTVDQVRHEEHG